MEKVVVGRKWNNPKIYAMVNDEKIEMSVDLEEYIVALAEAMGNPTLLVTKSALRAALLKANEEVLTEVKKASREVV